MRPFIPAVLLWTLLLGACGSAPQTVTMEEAAPVPTLSAEAEAILDTPLLEASPEDLIAEEELIAAAEATEADVASESEPESLPPATGSQLMPQPTVPVNREASVVQPAEQAALLEMTAPVRMIINEIGIDRSLVSVGLDANRVPVVPNHDVGWYNLGAKPGQGDNVVLWGHVLRFRHAPDTPAPFARMQELQPGARVTLVNENGQEFHYAVTQQIWAEPHEVQYILPQGREMVTMVSCIGDKIITEQGVEMTNRLITVAEPVD